MYPSKTIIFLMGRQRSGKDTIANYLVEHYGFKKHALADKLYEIVRDLFDMTVKDRDLLLALGAKMREIDSDVWLKYLWKTHVENAPEGARIVISDVRFPNEYDFLTEKGVTSLRISADLLFRKKREGFRQKYESSPSENYLLPCPADWEVVNEFSLSQLYGQVDPIIHSLGVKPIKRKNLFRSLFSRQDKKERS